jgi:hypothetical protein
MNSFKKYLINNKLFTENELKTLEPSQNNLCKLCNYKTGSLVKLNECLNNQEICLNCFDDFHDNYHENKKELFICLCCNKEIYTYDII